MTKEFIKFFYSQIGIRIKGIDVPDRVKMYKNITMYLFNNTDVKGAAYLGNYSFNFTPEAGKYLDQGYIHG